MFLAANFQVATPQMMYDYVILGLHNSSPALQIISNGVETLRQERSLGRAQCLIAPLWNCSSFYATPRATPFFLVFGPGPFGVVCGGAQAFPAPELLQHVKVHHTCRFQALQTANRAPSWISVTACVLGCLSPLSSLFSAFFLNLAERFFFSLV